MNEFDNVNNDVNNPLNNDFNVYNDSLLLNDEKPKKKRIHILNKKFFFLLFVIIILIAIFQVVYFVATKSYATYKLVSDVPEYVYINEPATFKSKFIGDKSNNFVTSYVLGNEYAFSLLKYENTGFENSNTIIPIQEGKATINISGILNPDSSIFNRNVLTKEYNVTVCPEFSLDLLKFNNISVVQGSFYNLGIDFGEGKCSEGISYDIANKSIATVNNLGIVSGLSVGGTNLTISKENKKIIVPIYVTPGKVIIKSSKAKNDKVQLVSGEKFRMNFEYMPFNATNVDIRYVSSNSKVASVSDKGVVEAIGIGISTIRIMSLDSTILGETTVVVEDPSDKIEPATAIEVPEEEINLKKGESRRILAVVVPNEALKSNSKWDTSNKGIITVDNNGVVFARAAGTAYVYITNGSIKKSVVVNVN